MLTQIGKYTHEARCEGLGLIVCCHSSSCLKAWGCPELPASNKQLLTSTFLVFFSFVFNDSFSLCSSGQCLEDSGIPCMAVRLAALRLSRVLSAHPAQRSERGRSQSPAQVWAAGGRNTHNERKLRTSPLQNQINNTFGKKKRLSKTSVDKILSFHQHQWVAEAEVFLCWKHGSVWELSLQSTNKQNPGSVLHSIVNHSWLSVYIFLHCKGILGPPPKQLVLSARFNLEWQD